MEIKLDPGSPKGRADFTWTDFPDVYRYVHPSDDRRFGGWGWSGRTHKHTSESDAKRKHLTLSGSTICLHLAEVFITLRGRDPYV